VLRAAPLFVWRDPKGVPWCDVIRESARKEFEAARRVRQTLLRRCVWQLLCVQPHAGRRRLPPGF
jgi:hypothetical protein